MVLSGSLILWVAWKGQAWREKAIERETKAAATAENQAETPTITTTTPTPTTTVVTESEKLQILNEQDGSKKEIIRKEVTISWLEVDELILMIDLFPNISRHFILVMEDMPPYIVAAQ